MTMKALKSISIIFLLFVFGCAAPHPAAYDSHKTTEEKYAQLLRVDREDISNEKLYSFIDDWYGTPYQYAGKTKKGVDCSGLTCILFKEVYGKELSGSSASIYNQCEKISKDKLREGDLVFFKIDSKEISHIGIYLQNNKFVHATTKAGVMIDDLDEEYYKKYFFGGGKLK
jgi:lipoprotein Spr